MESRRERKIRTSIRMFMVLFALLIILAGIPIYVINVNAKTSNTDTQQFANLVLFIQFSDSQGNFMATEEYGTNWTQQAIKFYQDETYPKSLVSYVDAISYGQLHVNSYFPQYDEDQDVIVPIQLDMTRDYYVQTNNEYILIADVLARLPEIDEGLVLDYDGDGCIDNVTFIYDGVAGDCNCVLYPHKSNFDCNGSINGKYIDKINVLSALETFGWGQLNQEGVICHEFLHSLGYPDLYKADSDISGKTPVGLWDIMASSSTFLQYPLAYLRAEISGWLTIDTITEECDLTLNTQDNPEGNQAYILKSPLSDTEFFVIEYRKKADQYSNKLDTKIPGSGLIIYRVDSTVNNYSNYTSTRNGIYVFREGETDVLAATKDNLLNKSFFSQESTRTSFGSTDLSATIADNALVFSDGSNSGIRISNITSASGDSITCHVEFADMSNAGLWETIGDKITDISANGITSAVCAGKLYVACGDNLGNTIRVYVYDNEIWQQYGNSITGYTNNMNLCFYNGVAYLLVNDTDFSAVLYKYANDNWEPATIISSSLVQYAEMDVAADGIYIIYTDTVGLSTTVKLAKYTESDGVAHLELIDPNIATGKYAYLDISTDENKVYFSFSDWVNNTIFVYAFENDSLIAYPAVTAGGSISNGLVCTDGTEPYMLVDCSTGVTVYRYNGERWSKLGGDIVAVTSANTDIEIDNGVIYVQIMNQTDTANVKVEVYKYANELWTKEGSNLQASMIQASDMLINDNKIYVAIVTTYDDINIPFVKFRKLGAATEKPNESEDEQETQDSEPPKDEDLEDIPEVVEVDRESIEAFVTRLYSIVLGRTPDPIGMANWVELLVSGQRSGADVAWGFFDSDEFKNRGYSNEEFTKIAYRTMLNREADYNGLVYWKDMLDNGLSREFVFRGFAESDEYTDICRSYGIKRGNVVLYEARDQKPNLTKFVARCYTKALNRGFDVDGINDWCTRIMYGGWSPEQVASEGFFHSQEFIGKNLSDEEYVKVLYETFLGRGYDESGLSDWLNRMHYQNWSRDDVLSGFVGSQEFMGILREFGLYCE